MPVTRQDLLDILYCHPRDFHRMLGLNKGASGEDAKDAYIENSNGLRTWVN